MADRGGQGKSHEHKLKANMLPTGLALCPCGKSGILARDRAPSVLCMTAFIQKIAIRAEVPVRSLRSVSIPRVPTVSSIKRWPRVNDRSLTVTSRPLSSDRQFSRA
jgi:hypothetical protein